MKTKKLSQFEKQKIEKFEMTSINGGRAEDATFFIPSHVLRAIYNVLEAHWEVEKACCEFYFSV